MKRNTFRRAFRVVLPLLGIVAALVAVSAVQAATSATQNVTFTVPPSVSIISDAAVSAGSVTVAADYGGSFTIGSNDAAGFSISTKATNATTTETGTCTPTASFAAAKVTVSVQPLGGMTIGTAGTPVAPAPYTTTGASMFSVNPTAQGPAVHMTSVYRLDPANFPPNTAGCSYVFATTWTIAAL